MVDPLFFGTDLWVFLVHLEAGLTFGMPNGLDDAGSARSMNELTLDERGSLCPFCRAVELVIFHVRPIPLDRLIWLDGSNERTNERLVICLHRP
jgi:hypothetical protein